MKVQEFIYQDTEIHFALKNDGAVMVNATEMAKAFNKRLDHFLRSEKTKAFLEVLEFTPFGGNSAPLKKSEIIQSRGQNGTYMHRVLALKFAAWLDPKFELWVFSSIDQIMFGSYKEHQEILKERVKAENEIKDLEKKLESSDEYKRMRELKELIKTNDYRKAKIIKTKLNQLRMELE